MIDDYLNAFKVQFFEFLQDKARRLWQQVASSVGVAQSNAATAPESRDITGAGEASRPPSINNPLGGTAQTVWNLWHTYGPHIMATGATMLQNAAPQNRPVPPQAPLSARSVPSPPHTPLSDDFRSSESEQEHPGPSFPVPVPASPFLELPSSLPLPPSSSHSPQTESDSDADPSGRYEEIETDEGEGYSIPQRPVQQERRSSWWGGWAAGKEGYDRVKEE